MKVSRFARLMLAALALGLWVQGAWAQTGQKVPKMPSGPPRRSVPEPSGPRPAPKPESSSNTTSATARHLVPDGSYEEDYIDGTNTEAWFSIPVYFEHTYALEAYVPYNYNGSFATTSLNIEVFESDGTTDITPSQDEYFYHPSLDEELVEGGDRRTFSNFSTDRFIRLRVSGCCATPNQIIYFHLRAVDLTQTAARWTVNGYNMYIALSNTSRDEIAGYVDYFDQSGGFAFFDSFDILPDGSAQLFHASGVSLGGALVGGIRVIPTLGAPGGITAHEYNYNPGVAQYLSFPFNPVTWKTGSSLQ